MSEQETRRLRQAMSRLMDAQEEASDAARRGLEHGSGDVDYEDSPGVSARVEGALVDVLDILEGAADDVRAILGDNAQERG